MLAAYIQTSTNVRRIIISHIARINLNRWIRACLLLALCTVSCKIRNTAKVR